MPSWRKITPVVLAVLVVGVVVFGRHHSPPAAPANFNTISDSSIGLSFNMSKDFEPISKEDLAAMNPGFSYGFAPANDNHTSCILSDIPLKGGGSISGEELRDGLLREIKKVHPNAALNNSTTAANLAKFGNAMGVLLQISYNDGGNKIKRVEVIAVGKTAEVIAYCQSLAADNAKYHSDFTIFFSSLKLN